MNPLMKENQILHMISDAAFLDREKLTGAECLGWIRFRSPRTTWLIPLFPTKSGGGLEFRPNEMMDRACSLMFDLAANHYISNVENTCGFLVLQFKECTGGRKPNFGARTVEQIMKVIERGPICNPEW